MSGFDKPYRSRATRSEFWDWLKAHHRHAFQRLSNMKERMTLDDFRRWACLTHAPVNFTPWDATLNWHKLGWFWAEYLYKEPKCWATITFSHAWMYTTWVVFVYPRTRTWTCALETSIWLNYLHFWKMASIGEFGDKREITHCDTTSLGAGLSSTSSRPPSFLYCRLK